MVYPAKLSRDAVVAAALDLVESQGRAALGMRTVAAALGVRPASLYKHVGDLAGLEALLAEAAAAALSREIDAAAAGDEAGDDGADAAFRRMAAVYARFARERPALYSFLVGEGVPAEPSDERRALWNRLLAAVAPLTGDVDDTGAAVAAWAFLHGFAALERAGMFGASGPRGGLARGVDALARGLAE